MQRSLFARWQRIERGVCAIAWLTVLSSAGRAQQAPPKSPTARPTSAKMDSARSDTVKPRPSRAPRLASRLNPPVTPGRAFLLSLALPGLGQSRLDRGVSGALFSGVELAAIAMLRRSSADLDEAKRYQTDSLPVSWTVSGSSLVPTAYAPNGFTADLVRTRRLHREDWLALLAFNHLISAADAFVSAQLWDVPVRLSVMPSADGAMIVATVRW
jgi:hypothetical protein